MNKKVGSRKTKIIQSQHIRMSITWVCPRVPVAVKPLW